MKIVIDQREDNLLTLFSLESRFSEINFEVKHLKVGDVQIFDNFGNLLLIIERKTVEDLISSINDKRYFKQLADLLETNPTTGILFAIEGNYEQLPFFARKLLIANLCLNKIPFTFFKSTNELFSFLRDILKSGKFLQKLSEIPLEKKINLLKKKKEKKKKVNDFEKSLLLIKNIGKSRAKKITKYYSSFKEIKDDLEKDEKIVEEKLGKVICKILKTNFSTHNDTLNNDKN